jgi:kynurenine---oxoglutarate transaminase / cysteine-S-conjugate beta-lyase / glutamine---phenylpyruvate transaminase
MYRPLLNLVPKRCRSNHRGISSGFLTSYGYKCSQIQRFSSFVIADRLKSFDKAAVWDEFTPLSREANSVNLGQGFPNWKTPDFITQAIAEVSTGDNHQMPRSKGDLDLCTMLSKHYSPLIGREIDPVNEVTISTGATGIYFGVIQAIINKGDEVICFEPVFDIYPPQVTMAGGVVKYVPLEVEDNKWVFDLNKFESAITSKTKLIIINTPHNPTGKVFSQEELEGIASVLRRHPHVYIATDEVYEKLIYEDNKHVHFSSIPDMFDRTITISSCGKTFSCTGWKVGWAIGPAHLIGPVFTAIQWVHYCSPSITSKALAQVLRGAEKPFQGFDSYFKYLQNEYDRKRNKLLTLLKEAHMEPVPSEGGYFVVANVGKFQPPQKYLDEPGLDGSRVPRDWAFSRWLTKEHGVTPIPFSAFLQTDEYRNKDQSYGK